MALTTYGTQIDLRPLPPRERQPLVASTFRILDPGESVEIVADEDPAPLRELLQAQWPGRLDWEAQPSGPHLWRVRVVKLARHGEGNCCGSCGGL
jgi:uncharacterized protein (DUF2249 family)